MTNRDPAQHRREDLAAVYPEWKCLLTGNHRLMLNLPLDLQIIDPHHILKRGGGDKVFSSVLGAVPLVRRLHDRADLHNPHMAAFFLEKADRAVQDAIRDGRYEYREVDYAFMEVRREYLEKHFPSVA